MLRMLLDAQNAFRCSECFQMLSMLHRMFGNAAKWFGRFQSASEGFRMLQNAVKCLWNVSQNVSQNASQDASKCFGRFQNAAKGFESLFGIALECFKMLQNKFVFFVNYSDRPILRILLGLTKKQYMIAVYMIVGKISNCNLWF